MLASCPRVLPYKRQSRALIGTGLRPAQLHSTNNGVGSEMHASPAEWDGTWGQLPLMVYVRVEIRVRADRGWTRWSNDGQIRVLTLHIHMYTDGVSPLRGR